MYVIAVIHADGRKDWEIVSDEDAMKIKVSELVLFGWLEEDIIVGSIID